MACQLTSLGIWQYGSNHTSSQLQQLRYGADIPGVLLIRVIRGKEDIARKSIRGARGANILGENITDCYNTKSSVFNKGRQNILVQPLKNRVFAN